jgi:hypothetical protein
MQSILYWSFLILFSILAAYAGPFALFPLTFLAGAAILVAGYLTYLAWRRRRSGLWEHRRHQSRFTGSAVLYVMIYWTTIVLFTNVKEQREFVARYEPYVQDGVQHGYTFYYVDYEGSYERIDSPKLNEFLAEKRPQQVRMVLEIVRDFGKLRAYSVRSVESIPVVEDWTEGRPPWDALRAPGN